MLIKKLCFMNSAGPDDALEHKAWGRGCQTS